MAGFYPDVPNYRMPYDTDGASLYYWSSTIPSIVSLTESQMRNANSENNDIAYSNSHSLGQSIIGLVFPELRYIYGYFINISFVPTAVEYSTNTTTGLDGTWSVVDQTVFYTNTKVLSEYRTNINSLTMNSGNPVKGIRFVGQTTDPNIKAFHIYGKKASASDRIVFWHPTLNQEVSPSHFDFGDIEGGTEYKKEFRLKNVSTNRSANNITISIDSTNNTTPALTDQFSLSPDDVLYSDSIVLDFLAYGSISDVFYIKKEQVLESAYGPYSLRIKTNPEVWVGVA